MNFRQVKKKIKTVKNVKKITNAMQMVSAVKMRKAQQVAMEGREYRLMLDAVLQKIIGKSTELKEFDIPWVKETMGTKQLCILVSSNKGLCGAFHTYLFKKAYEVIKDGSCDFIVVGQKGAQFISMSGIPVLADFSAQLPYTDSVSAILSLIEEKYTTGEYNRVSVIYNKYISSISSVPTVDQLAPISKIDLLVDDDENGVADAPLAADYMIEPSVSELLAPLLEDYLKEKLRSAFADSEAAEHSARMMAMKAATDNAGDLIDNLTLLGNRLRQSQITNELLDMVAAKESTEITN